MNKELIDQIIKENMPPVVHAPYNWQSIETAPKDGHPIDLWVTYCCFGREQSYRAANAHWSKRENGWAYRSGYPIEEQGAKVTHWIRIGKP